MLSVIDQHWREHLYEMDYLQEGINLRAMGQQDPLVGVAARGLRHVRGDDGPDRGRLRRATCSHLQVVGRRGSRGAAVAQRAVQRARGPGAGLERDARAAASAAEAARDAAPAATATTPMPWPTSDVVQQPVRVEKTPGRNEPCFCGSGKKFKLCHGR